MDITKTIEFQQLVDRITKQVAACNPDLPHQFPSLDNFFHLTRPIRTANPRAYDDACDVFTAKVARGLPHQTADDLKRLAMFMDKMIDVCDPEGQSLIDALNFQSAILDELHHIAPNTCALIGRYALKALQFGDCVEGGAIEDELIQTWENSMRTLFRINPSAAFKQIEQSLQLMSHTCLFNVEAQLLQRDLKQAHNAQKYSFAYGA